MKTLKRFLVIAAVLIFGMASASALDSSYFMSQYIGDASLEEFSTTFEEITEDYFLSMLSASLGSDAEITEFYQLTDANCGEEELDMIDAVEDYLIDTEGIDGDEIYMVMAIRGIDAINSRMDAWIVFSHCANSSDFTHVAYYIALNL